MMKTVAKALQFISQEWDIIFIGDDDHNQGGRELGKVAYSGQKTIAGHDLQRQPYRTGWGCFFDFESLNGFALS